MVEPGDYVKAKSKDLEVEGTLIPSPKENLVTIKLDNGYNIGFKSRNVKITLLEKKKPSSKTKSGSIKKSPKLKNISILHCGGTVASKVDYKTGGVTALFNPEELQSLFPELKTIANIESRLVKQMMSENMRFAHYNIIAKEIQKEIKKGVDGIILTHGTDTLHYTSAALSFMLENLPIPIILVGSQRSSDRGSSDASMNLLSAATFIANTDFADVAICMHKNIDDETCLILPSTKTRKMHTSRRDAFRAINKMPFAEVDFRKKEINFLRNNFVRVDKKRNLSIKPFKEDIKVAIIKAHPNMYAEELNFYKDYEGIIFEGTGLGHMSNNEFDEVTKENGKIMEEIRKLSKKTVLVMTSQCLYGRVDMNVYSEGRKNIEAGILGNDLDMTPETTFIKLAWLLSNYSKDETKELLSKDLRGEISERIENSTYLQ